MIPKILHYIWFGSNPLTPLAEDCLASWKEQMSDWQIMRWDETNFDIAAAPFYVRQAYEARKYAFVSDYVRLWALEQFGGVYLDTDVQVLRPFEPLLNDTAFIGLEESLAHLPGTCVMGCEPHCRWAKDMLSIYETIHFVLPDGALDLTTNVQRMGEKLIAKGFVPCRKEQYIADYGLRVYTHDYFSPITSTRVMRKTRNTYSIHHFAGSWTNKKHHRLCDSWIVRETINALIQIKRKLKGIE